MLNLRTRLMNLMAFDGDDGGGSGGGGTGGEEDKNKTFTQEDLNRIATKEKNEGKMSLLKAFGFENEDDAKSFIAKAKKSEQDSLTEAEKLKLAKEEADKIALSSNQKAILLEQKLEAIKGGVMASAVDDVIVLVNNRMNDKTDFAAALEVVKKAYPAFFAEDKGTGGTGGAGNPARKGGSADGIQGMGKRLGEKKAASQSKAKEVNYFG